MISSHAGRLAASLLFSVPQFTWKYISYLEIIVFTTGKIR